MPEPNDLPLATRIWFAWVCFFRVLFDGPFAARAFAAREPARLPEVAARVRVKKRARDLEPDGAADGGGADPRADEPTQRSPKSAPPPAKPAEPPPVTPALQLLALLQREGRLVDFVEQDIATAGDGDVAAAARVVHEGCRKALREHLVLAPVRSEDEGSQVTLEAGFSPAEIKLTGDVRGSAPYKGVLRHRGWRAEELKLPKAMQGHDARVLAPAEVEL